MILLSGDAVDDPAGLGLTELWSAPSTTTAGGYYLFDNLPAGRYRVVFQAPAEMIPVEGYVGGNTAIDANNSGEFTRDIAGVTFRFAYSEVITLGAGEYETMPESNRTIDMGFMDDPITLPTPTVPYATITPTPPVTPTPTPPTTQTPEPTPTPSDTTPTPTPPETLPPDVTPTPIPTETLPPDVTPTPIPTETQPPEPTPTTTYQIPRTGQSAASLAVSISIGALLLATGAFLFLRKRKVGQR